MCGDSPPPAYKGPGDAHSNQEWIWQRERYLDLFDEAPEGTLRGESTPFYLYNRDARRRIAVDNARRQADRGAARPGRPGVLQLDAPVDGRPRAARRHRRGGRARAGAHRRRLGAVLALPGPGHVRPPGQGPLRPLPARAGAAAALQASWSTSPTSRSTGSSGSSASRARRSTQIPSDNTRPFVRDGVRARTVGPVIRAGAAVGQFLPPAGVAHGQQAADQPAAQGRRPGAAQADPRAARAAAGSRTSRTSSCSRRSPGSRSSSGGPTATAARSRAGRARSAQGQRGLSVVTRSCAPSGRASSK